MSSRGDALRLADELDERYGRRVGGATEEEIRVLALDLEIYGHATWGGGKVITLDASVAEEYVIGVVVRNDMSGGEFACMYVAFEDEGA